MKTSISNLHLEILDDTRKAALEKILPFTESFVLGGGTALSLQIAHRLSFDFDFFSQKEIKKSLLEKISQTVSVKEVLVRSIDELTFLDSNDIKYTFLNYYFPNCYDILEYDNGMKLFSIKEIAVKKAYTIGRRGVYRDYFDIFAILKDNYSSLKEINENAQKVYQGVFSPKLFLEKLVYFNDLPDFDISPLDSTKDISPDAVKQFLEKAVRDYLADNI